MTSSSSRALVDASVVDNLLGTGTFACTICLAGSGSRALVDALVVDDLLARAVTLASTICLTSGGGRALDDTFAVVRLVSSIAEAFVGA